MRLLAILVVMTVFYAFSASVRADEFGARFYAQAPRGLGDYTAPEVAVQNVASDDKVAEDLQNIMPAAGEEEPENKLGPKVSETPSK